jgi:hypothetical protein
MAQQKIKISMEISIEWSRLITLVERAKYGKCEIIFKDGNPTDVRPLIPHVRLDDDKQFEEGFKSVGL